MDQQEHMQDEESVHDEEDIEEGEIIDDSLDYFKPILEKMKKQGPTININLATGVTEILKSGLNTSAKEKFTEIYLYPEN